MFVRFQRHGARLHARLLQTRRISGKVQSEYIGALGSVDAAVSVRERLAFWAKLPERLRRLGNRVGADEHAIYAALHARIPMVTPDEQRAIQEENAKEDERFWNMMRDVNASSAEGHKLLAASCEAKHKEHERAAANAAERRGIARWRLELFDEKFDDGTITEFDSISRDAANQQALREGSVHCRDPQAARSRIASKNAPARVHPLTVSLRTPR